jgi:hypothetical protein
MSYAFSSVVCIAATACGFYLGVARVQSPTSNDLYKTACVLQLGDDDDVDTPLRSLRRPPHDFRMAAPAKRRSTAE